MKKKILFVADVREWAYDDAAKNWQRLLKSSYDIDIIYLNEYPIGKLTLDSAQTLDFIKKIVNKIYIDKEFNPDKSSDFFKNYKFASDGSDNILKPAFDCNKYDGILFFYHRAHFDKRLISTPIDLSKVAICINNDKWKDDGAEKTVKNFYTDVKMLVGCNSKIVSEFSKYHPKVMRASQSINEDVFFYNRSSLSSGRTGPNFIMGWCGNYSNKIKNVNLVKNWCYEAGVKLRIAKNLDRKQLNIWYNSIDAVICASDSEGGPLMLLEAGACALPILTTRVGLANEIITNNYNGIFIDKDNKSDTIDKIKKISMDTEIRKSLGSNLRKEILKNWTYNKRINEITNILKEF